MNYPQEPGDFPVSSQNYGMILDYMLDPENPWNGFNHDSAQFNNQHIAPIHASAYPVCRSAAISDYGTNPTSDSGYVSLSMGLPPDSLGGEGILDPSFHALDSRLDQFGATVSTAARFAKLPRSGIPQSATVSEAGAQLICEVCSKVCQSKATLKKHKQRHQRSFQCRDPSCNNKEGFGTLHDLDRHERSVHKKSGKSYRCNIDECNSKGKSWPRVDNFRSHLKGVHAIPADHITNSYLEQFMICPPSPSRPPPSQDVLKAVGSAVLDPTESTVSTDRSRDEHDGLSAELERLRGQEDPLLKGVPSRNYLNLYRRLKAANLDGHPSSIIGPVPGGRTAQKIMVPEVPAFDAPPTPITSPASHSGLKGDLSTCASPITGGEDTDQLPLESRARQTTSSTRPCGRTEEGATNDMTESSADSPSTSDITSSVASKASGTPLSASYQCEKDYIQMLDRVPEHVIQSYLKRKLRDISSDLDHDEEEPRPATRQKQEHKCRDCNKVFSRKCELNKHMKRHDRPYGCTFRPCNKKFGSKSDWRRHETSQHFQLEMWSCDQCPKAYHRRETFKRHLEDDHKIVLEEDISEKLESCRVDRHSDTKFWCGFCEMMIPIPVKKEPGFWNERYNHIEEHFAGRNNGPARDISEWKWGADGDPPSETVGENEGQPSGFVTYQGPEASSKRAQPTHTVMVADKKRKSRMESLVDGAVDDHTSKKRRTG